MFRSAISAPLKSSLPLRLFKPLTLPLAIPSTSRALSTSLNRFNAAASASSSAIPSSDGSATTDIKSKLKDALKAAMKGKDKEATSIVKALMADMTYYEKGRSDPSKPVEEENYIDVLRKAIDKRHQAISTYPDSHPSRTTLLSEITFIRSFLPSTLSPSAITEVLSGIISGLSAEDRAGKGATGKVLQGFWEVVKKGEVEDKKRLGREVAELLKSLK